MAPEVKQGRCCSLVAGFDLCQISLDVCFASVSSACAPSVLHYSWRSLCTELDKAFDELCRAQESLVARSAPSVCAFATLEEACLPWS